MTIPTGKVINPYPELTAVSRGTRFDRQGEAYLVVQPGDNTPIQRQIYVTQDGRFFIKDVRISRPGEPEVKCDIIFGTSYD